MKPEPNRTLSTLATAFALCASSLAQAPMERPDLVETATRAGKFETLLTAAKAAGLADTLAEKGPFTVFAPTDEAFAALGKQTIESLLQPANKDRLVEILTYHVVPGRIPASKVVTLDAAKTVAGSTLPIAIADGKVRVADANVIQTDVMASNGVIHVIDRVLMPPKNLVEVANDAGSFATLLAAAKAAGLADTLANDGPFTIFAPTDEAFAALGKDTIAQLLKPESRDKLRAILLHHVVSGKVMAQTAIGLKRAKTLGKTELPLHFDAKAKVLHVGAAKVTKTDIEAGNGVIHVVDKVLLPN